jgi:hypothetical protein
MMEWGAKEEWAKSTAPKVIKGLDGEVGSSVMVGVMALTAAETVIRYFSIEDDGSGACQGSCRLSYAAVRVF